MHILHPGKRTGIFTRGLTRFSGLVQPNHPQAVGPIAINLPWGLFAGIHPA
jgi:hypothetical protein